MWLKQKVYTLRFTREDAIRKDTFDSIIVKLNDKLTTIKLQQLFAKISNWEFSEDGNLLIIKGWSILQEVKSGKLKVGESEIDISFEAEDLSSLSIELIENPWWILNDIELSDSDVAEINSKLLELSGLDKSTEDLTDQAESPHTLPSVIVNESYNKGRVAYEKVGFKEYVKDNFRLLLKAESDKSILIELKDEKDLIQYKKSTKVIDNFYKFEDETNNRVIDVKIIGDDLDISFSDVEEPEQTEGESSSEINTLTNN